MTWVAIVWLLATGVGIAHCALPRARLSEKLALAFPLSSGLHGAVNFILMQSGNAPVYWSALVFSPFLLFAPKALRFGGFNWNRKDCWALAFIFLATLQVAVHVLITPAFEWDSVSMWFLKGKALTAEGRLTSGFMSRFQELHAAYPLNLPMIYAWLGRMKGWYSEDASKLVIFIYFCSLLFILYSLARLKWPRTASLAFVAGYSAIPYALVITFNRDADIILATFIAATMLLLIRYQLHPGAGTLILLTAATFFCSWTKVEGIAFSTLLLLPFAAMPFLFSRNPFNKRLLISILIGSVMGLAAFWIPKQIFGTEIWLEQADFAHRAQLLGKTPGIAGVMLAEMANVWHWNFAWFLIPLLLWKGKDRYQLKFLVGGQVALYLIVYLLSPYPWRWHMSTSLSRLLLHVLPTLFAWTVFAIPAGTEDIQADAAYGGSQRHPS